MLLRNDRVLLRAVEADDLDVLYRWENDTSQWDSSSAIAPFSRKQLWDYIENYDGDIFASRQLRFMIVDRASETAAGMIDLFDFDAVNRRASVGILVDLSFRGRGIGASALCLLEEYCRERIGMHQLYATTACDNRSALAMFENAGFGISGRLRSWIRRGESYIDMFLLQKLF